MSAHGKRKPDLEIPIADENDVLQITCLGAGNEVGRSCIVLQYKGKTVMLDAGGHPAYNGLASLPFFDEIDPSTVDVLLVSHFHIDHAASVPYLMEKTTFKGRVFMTHPTKAIYKWLLADYIRVGNISTDETLYTEADLTTSYQRIEAVDYLQTIEISSGLKFTSYNAGHVLGAAMFLVEIAGVKILYTGDYSREEDRHLMAAEKPEGIDIDVLITESTYGVQSHEPRLEKETRFTSLVHEIVLRGGRVLLPVFALGRAQELLLILDEYWSAHPELESIPIYYASSLAKKCMTVYQTYINMMNTRIRRQFAISNPFVFKHISNLKNMEGFEDTGPCVMMASPGMLQSGLSRELFERWAPDRRNGLVITGYCVEGTLARQALNDPTEILAMDGRKIQLRMSVHYISFSAHVDYTQNAAFIDDVKAPYVILVHGESNAMGRLKSALQDKYNEREENIKIYTPRNSETVRLTFRGEKMARTLGRLAATQPTDSSSLTGILVQKDFQYNIMAAADLPELAGLRPTIIVQRQTVSFSVGIELLKWHLEQMFGKVKEATVKDIEKNNEQNGEDIKDSQVRKIVKEVPVLFTVFDTVGIKQAKPGEIILEWVGNSMNDMIADSVLAVILGIESSPASVKATYRSHTHDHSANSAQIHEIKHKKDDEIFEEKDYKIHEGEDYKIHEEEDEIHEEKDDEIRKTVDSSTTKINESDNDITMEEFDDIAAFLEQQYGKVKQIHEQMMLEITVDGTIARVNCRNLQVETSDKVLRERISSILVRVGRTLRPIPEMYVC